MWKLWNPNMKNILGYGSISARPSTQNKKMLTHTLLLFTCLVSTTFSTSSSSISNDWQTVRGKVKIPQTPRPPTMQVILNEGSSEMHKTFTRVDGSFSLDNVPPGIYTLEVMSTQFHFGKYTRLLHFISLFCFFFSLSSLSF